jgi:DNA-binding response OmpR family regulator
MSYRVLLVEDDENLGIVTKDFLEMSGFKVTHCLDGKSGLDEYNRNEYDILILDVMLPQIDGFTLADTIRKKDTTTPIIFLTARSMKEDRVKGFKLGGDDYIVKPFSTEELKLRIEAILKRTRKAYGSGNETYSIGPFQFNYSEHLLSSPNLGTRHLTKREADVLKMLCEHKNKILRRDIALKSIWGDNDYFMGRSMDVYITKLRKMLKTEDGVSISNIHNTGFKLEVEEKAEQTQTSDK